MQIKLIKKKFQRKDLIAQFVPKNFSKKNLLPEFLLSGNRLPKGRNRLPEAQNSFIIDLNLKCLLFLISI